MKININEIQEYCKSIVEKEIINENMEISINPITLVEFYNTDIFKQQTKLKRTQEKLYLRKVAGLFSHQNQKIYIFTDNLEKKHNIDIEYKFPLVLYVLYHELRHQMQYSNKVFTQYEKFISQIEEFFINLNPTDYKLNHSGYFREIDANLYAYNKVLKYIKEKHPPIYHKAKHFLETKWITESKYYYINYDSQQLFDKLYKFCKSRNYAIILLNIEKLDIFIDHFNNFRPLNKIIKLSKKENISKDILLTVLGSKAYLKQLNISKLNMEEKLFILDIINKLIEKENIRLNENIEFYKEQKLNNKEHLKSIKNILLKIKYHHTLKYIIDKNINEYLNLKSKKLQRIKNKILYN